ncbi:hypothetical protein [Patulibacter sp.]|uniref:hypothetical protein n=1 Tax=Patulibacter sp. TaxID=1912859 RepID=UPI002722EF54|nr:hypothetical protein [Patulibacter sp.]MDO9410153.1 hypothetical protein [Patulibacter sp.]
MSPGAAGTPVLARLAAALREEGGLPPEVVHDPLPDADDRIGRAVADGPRAADVGPALSLAAEATREAELLHHAPEHARVVRTDDRDLALLAGDRLYALGLERLAVGGWTDEVAILADVVALVARLHGPPAMAIGPASDGEEAGGTGAPDEAAARTTVLWSAAAAALGGGAGSRAAVLLRDVRDGGLPDSNALTAVSAASPDGPPEH